MSNSRKIVAVTGATGFLGRFIVARLLTDGYKVRCLVRDESFAKNYLPKDVEIFKYSIDDINSVRKAVIGCNIIVHTAAIHNRKMSDKESIFKINVEGTKNLIESAESLDAFVFISSIRSMTTNRTSQIDENTEYDFAKYDTPYGSSKYLAEKLCLQYYQSHKLPLYILNPAPIIGPEDSRLSHNGKMIFDHLRKTVVFVTRAMWPIVDVRDVADAIPFILENGKKGERHILCSANLQLKEFFLMIDKAANQKKLYINIPYLPLKFAGLGFEMIEMISPTFEPPIVSSSVEVAKMMTEYSGDKIHRMGFNYRRVDETITDTVNWFSNNQGLFGKKPSNFNRQLKRII